MYIDRLPQLQKYFNIYTDSSNYQLGGVVIQEGHPIACCSNKINQSQINYNTMDKGFFIYCLLSEMF